MSLCRLVTCSTNLRSRSRCARGVRLIQWQKGSGFCGRRAQATNSHPIRRASPGHERFNNLSRHISRTDGRNHDSANKPKSLNLVQQCGLPSHSSIVQSLPSTSEQLPAPESNFPIVTVLWLLEEMEVVDPTRHGLDGFKITRVVREILNATDFVTRSRLRFAKRRFQRPDCRADANPAFPSASVLVPHPSLLGLSAGQEPAGRKDQIGVCLKRFKLCDKSSPGFRREDRHSCKKFLQSGGNPALVFVRFPILPYLAQVEFTLPEKGLCEMRGHETPDLLVASNPLHVHSPIELHELVW